MDPRRLVKLHKEHISDVSSTDYPHVYPGETHNWNLKSFKKKLKVQVYSISEEVVEFDLIGIDASVANAFRRILIAEVPTIAIERVYIYDNTSIIQDEVLSHRLGLVPIKVDLDQMEDAPVDYQSGSTDRNTVIFKLHAECHDNPSPAVPSTSVYPGPNDPERLFIGSNVFAKDMEWVPAGEQATMFQSNPPRPVNGNILLAKLRPGQVIDLEMHAVKSTGKDHAKYSPVGTATYRLLPHIEIAKEGIPSELCDQFSSCFSPGVINVTTNKRTGKKQAEVVNPRLDTVSRQVLQHPEFEGLVKLSRVRDHFCWKIESIGQYDAVDLFPTAIQVLQTKIRGLIGDVERLQHEWEAQTQTQGDADGDIEMGG